MKNLIVYPIIIASLFIINGVYGQDDQFIAKSNKEIYLIEEPIWIKIVLKNKGAVAGEMPEINIGNFHKGFLKIHLEDINGNQIRYAGPRAHGGGLETEKLAAGDSTWKYFDMLDSYGEKLIPPFWGRFNLKEGTYKLIASLDGYNSQEISFIIEMPSGKEKSAYELFYEGYKKYVTQNDNYQEAIDIFKKAIDIYPASVYTELYYSFLRQIYLDDKMNAIKLIKEYIKKYPENPRSQKMINHLRVNYTNIREIEKFEEDMHEISQKYKKSNPELSKHATKQLEKIKKRKMKDK